jgi:hypothetical protein
MLYENGQYTDKINEMNAGQVWRAWKNQNLNMGQVATWQDRNGYILDLDQTKTSYHIVVDTENKKHDVIMWARKCGADVTNISGYYEGYYINFEATAGQVNFINNRIGGMTA